MRIALLAGLLAIACAHEAPQASARLSDTSWLFVEIDGHATELTGDLLRDDRYAVDFSPDVIVGYSGCNRFSGRYSRSGDILTFEPLASTLRGCGERIMMLERRLFEILEGPVRISFPDRGTMLLTGESGAIRLRQTADWND